MRWSDRALIYGVACLALGLAPAASAAVLVVGGGRPGAYPTIQRALAAAHAGDTIEVASGVYEGNLLLDRPVVLQGVGTPTIRGTGRGSVVLVTAPGCTIRGFAIEHSGSDLQREDAGILLRSGHNRIEGNRLRDILFGIYLFHSAGNTLRGNTVRGRRELPLGERGSGVHLWTSDSNTIEDNVITEARDGFYIQSSNHNAIRRNRVMHLRYGLHYMYSDANVFEENQFSDNVAGAAIMYSRHIEFRRNAFVHNRGFSSFGILFQACDECLAEGNFVLDNATGIFMEALRKSTVRNNVIAENDVAMELFSSSEENVLTGNDFVENLSPLMLVGHTSGTQWEQGGRGNYWSDYSGYDLDANGIGDVPHRVQNVFEYMEGNYPRLRLYLNSPAAQAMAMAETTFPIVRGSPEVDQQPLMRPVPVRFPFTSSRVPRRRHGPLLGTSLAALAVALTIVWRSQREHV